MLFLGGAYTSSSLWTSVRGRKQHLLVLEEVFVSSSVQVLMLTRDRRHFLKDEMIQDSVVSGKL